MGRLIIIAGPGPDRGEAFVAPLQGIDTQLLKSDLASAIGPERWRIWFDGATDFRLGDGGLQVGVANCFISDYIKSHFQDCLAEALRRQAGEDLPITFRVLPDLYQRRRAKNLADEEEAVEVLDGRPAEARRPKPAPARARRSTPVATPRKALFTLENFVVGPCNRLAYAAAQSAAGAPGREFHPLFIHGACGLGKTHLLSGVLHALDRHGPLRVAFLSAEQFTNRFLSGMRTGSLDAFRHRYRNLDVLAIDDVHFLAGKPSTQEEFLHTFNEFEGHGRLIILASDAHPRDIKAIQDRLISRFVSGLVVRLDRPDAETRRRILQAKSVQLRRPMPAEVLEFVAARIEGNVRDLEGALARLIAYAALLKQPVTVALARQAIGELIVAAPGRTGVKEIAAAAAEFFGVTVADIHSKRKSRHISLARQCTMVLARQMTDLSFSEIARQLGGKNHTTVLAAQTKWRDLVKRGGEVSWTDKHDPRTMKAEELLEHLKDRLRR